MNESFDPYHKWLGIPPAEQPPNHYRLLGLTKFESDLDVVENAFEGRMALIKTFQSGPHARQSQDLLNELAAARNILLDDGKRDAYDAHLRALDQQAAPQQPQRATQSEPASDSGVNSRLQERPLIPPANKTQPRPSVHAAAAPTVEPQPLPAPRPLPAPQTLPTPAPQTLPTPAPLTTQPHSAAIAITPAPSPLSAFWMRNWRIVIASVGGFVLFVLLFWAGMEFLVLARQAYAKATRPNPNARAQALWPEAQPGESIEGEAVVDALVGRDLARVRDSQLGRQALIFYGPRPDMIQVDRSSWDIRTGSRINYTARVSSRTDMDNRIMLRLIDVQVRGVTR